MHSDRNKRPINKVLLTVLTRFYLLETGKSVSKLFTKGSHYQNISVIYISQNLFSKNKENSKISLNT